jgi:hypothetical protein
MILLWFSGLSIPRAVYWLSAKYVDYLDLPSASRWSASETEVLAAPAQKEIGVQ